MPRSYQRASRAAAATALLAFACGRPESPLPATPVGSVEPGWILASKSYEPVGALDGGRWVVANEAAAGRHRAVVLRVDAETPQPIPLGAPATTQSRALGVFRDGSVVALETWTTGDASSRELRLVDAAGRATARARLDPSERVVAIAPDADRVWTARPDESVGRLLERSLPSGRGRPVPGLPGSFEVALVARDGRRVVLRRAAGPGRDEVLLFDRDTGSATLVLPTEHDGRFVPLALSEGASRLLVAADETDRAPRLLELDLGTLEPSVLPGSPCDAIDASPLGDTGWLVRRSCDDGLRLSTLETMVELPEPPLEGVRWRRLVPVGDGRWLGAAAPQGAPADLWLVGPSDRRLPLTWGLAPRLDPRALPRPEAIDLPVRGGRRTAARWRAQGEAKGAVLWIEPAPGASPVDDFAPLQAALAVHGVESVRVALESDGADGSDRLDALVDAWEARAQAPRRAVVAARGAASESLLERARRRAGPALIAFAPSPSGSDAEADPEAGPDALRSRLTLVVERPSEIDPAAIDPSDPRLGVLRAARPSAPGEWPIELYRFLLRAAESAPGTP